MRPNHKHKRPYGTGSLIVRRDRAGRETWAGSWWGPDGRRVLRKIGRKRSAAFPDGLTEPQANRRLREMMGETQAPGRADRHTLAEAAEAHLLYLENQGTKRSTLGGYRSLLSTYLLPYLGRRDVGRITEKDVAAFDRLLRDRGRGAFDAKKPDRGLSAQSRRNTLGLLGAVMQTALKRGWATRNPVADYDKPRRSRSEPEELRFLTLEELEAVLRVMPDTPLGRVERAVVLTAGMTGLRRGELLGLRWKDVDWPARTIRVVRTYVGGRPDTPKSDQSRRSVPMADRVAGELQRLWEATPHQGDDEPVFAHPDGTGLPLDGSAAAKAFKAALERAGVRRVRFHDLRHTFGTVMAADPRVSMRTLQGWLGHADPATTAIYSHFAPNDLHAAWIGEAFTAPPVEDRQEVSR